MSSPKVLKYSRTLSTSLIAMTLGSTLGAFANSVETVTGLASGTVVYRAVIENDSEETNEKPGYYIRKGNSWKLILPGEISVNEKLGPVLARLKSTELDQKDSAISLINGKLTLFHRGSNHKKSGTYYEFGSKETPLFDLVSGQKRYLPKISTSENIQIFQFKETDENSNAYTGLIISVAFDELGPLGDGITFIARIRTDRSNKDIELLEDPKLIVNEALTAEAMSKLIGKSGDGLSLKSPLISEQIISRGFHHFGEHSEIVKNWVERNFEKLENLASYNLDKKVIKQTGSPDFGINLGEGFRFRQVYDLVLGSSHLEIQSQHGGRSKKYPYVLDFEKDEDDYLPRVYSSDVDSEIVMFHADKTLYLALDSGSRRDAAIVEVDTPYSHYDFHELPERFSFHHILYEDPKDKTTNIIVITSELYLKKNATLESLRGEDLYPRTTAYRFQLTGNGIHLEKKLHIANYYLNDEELLYRSSQSESSKLLFDTITPPQKSESAYHQSSDLMLPRLDLIASLKTGRSVYQYTTPEHDTEIAAGLRYKVYKHFEGVANPTGVETSIKANKSDLNSIIPGKLLYWHNDGQDSPYSTRTKLKIKQQRNEFEYNAFAISTDAKMSKGESGFLVSIYLSATSEGLSDLATSISIKVPYQNITGIQLLTGIKSYSNRLVLVVSHDEPNAKTFQYHFEIDPIKGEIHTTGKGSKLSEEGLNNDDILARRAFDSNGKPYFVTTPNKKHMDKGFTLIDFESNRAVYPNKNWNKDGKGPKFNFDQMFAGGQELPAEVLVKDSWVLNSRPSIESAYPLIRDFPYDEAQLEVFKSLTTLLDEAAKPTENKRLKVLLVSDRIKSYVWNFILSRYLHHAPSGTNEGFSVSNFKSNLAVFRQNLGNQDAIMDNFESFAHSQKDTVLIGQLKEILETGRPAGEPDNEEPFMLSSVKASEGQSEAQIDTSVDARLDETLPHALYLLATQGSPLTLDQFRKEQIKIIAQTLLIGTPDEWEALQSHAEIEGENGLFERFEIIEMPNPDDNAKKSLLSNVINKPEIRSLGLRFDGDQIVNKGQLNPKQSQDAVLGYAVSRANMLAQQKNLDPFSSFMEFVQTFGRLVLVDKQVRKDRRLDKTYVERVLNRVYNIPLNLATLPDEDPLRILSHRDAVFKLQEAGYEGPFDLKEKVIRTILSQMQNDPARSIPSSQIYFGETGTGKTHLFKSLMKMIGLEPYDYVHVGKESNAGYIIINVGRLVKDKASRNSDKNQGLMTVSEAIDHLQNFLTLPNGSRGHILFDDVHAASPEVRSEIIQQIRALFEAENGMYMARSAISASTAKIPVRNLNIYMTFNPTDDQDQIKRFSKDPSAPTETEIALASLSSGSEVSVEKSFLKRWSSIVNLSQFPAGAKGPELMKASVDVSRDVLSQRSILNIVDPRLIESIVEAFPDTDARTFLSSSTQQLLGQEYAAALGSPVNLIVPKVAERFDGSLDLNQSSMDGDRSRIAHFIESSSRAIPITEDINGVLNILPLLVSSFRNPVYETLVSSLFEDPQFLGNTGLTRTILAPTLLAINDHLNEHQRIPLHELSLDPMSFGIKSPSERFSFGNRLKAMSENSKEDYFPFSIGSAEVGQKEFLDLTEMLPVSTPLVSRSQVVNETVQSNEEVLHKHLESILNVESLGEEVDIEEWILTLPANDTGDVKKVGRALRDNLWSFWQRNYSMDVAEMQNPDSVQSMTPYATARMFLYALDKAIANLPWAEASNLVVKGTHQLASNMVLSQSAGVQNFLFTSKFSLLRPNSGDLSKQLIANAAALDTVTKEFAENQSPNFKKSCGDYLMSTSSGGQSDQE